ncbi:hypothetical protein ACWPKO_06000 [Coraliomargarita sp. W4R53]
MAAVWLGFLFLEIEQVVGFIGHYGYWFVALPFILLCLECVSPLRRDYVSRFESGRLSGLFALKRLRVAACCHGLPIAFVLFVSGLLLASQPARFKVVMDEPMLLATSMQMYQERQAYAVIQSYELEGGTVAVSKVVDKRPLFFPFLLSVLHDLTGYRPTQGFCLNALLLVIFMGASFRLGGRLCSPYGGYLLVGLFATVPLLIVNATSSGFDLLNILMILLLGARLEAYLRVPDALRLNLLLLVTVLLAQTRYESVLFILPVAVTILYVWLREREVNITKTMIFVPLMLIVFAFQRRMMNGYESFWELPEGLDHPFGLRFIGDNLQIAFNFFAHSNELYPNSLLLTVLFIIAVAVLGYLAVKRRAALGQSRVAALPWLGVGLIVGVNFMLLMAYHWGRLDDPVAARLALPILLFECFVVLFAFGALALNQRWQLALGAVILVYFVTVTRPLYARTDFFEWSVRGTQCDYLLELCEDMRISERSLIISELSVVSSIARTSSVATSRALDEFAKIDLHLRMHTFDEVYVFYLLRTKDQHVVSDYFPGIDQLKERLETRFELETLDEIKVNDAIYMRLALVASVRMGSDATYEIDAHGMGINADGDFVYPEHNLAEAFAESLPK